MKSAVAGTREPRAIDFWEPTAIAVAYHDRHGDNPTVALQVGRSSIVFDETKCSAESLDDGSVKIMTRYHDKNKPVFNVNATICEGAISGTSEHY